MMKITHIVGGSPQGGAERFFQRLALAFNERDIPQQIIARNHAPWNEIFPVKGIDFCPNRLPQLGTWFSRFKIKQALKQFQPDIVMTWMSRASSLCPKGTYLQVGRLGGYYAMKYFQTCDYLIGNTPDIVRYLQENGWPVERAHYIGNFADLPAHNNSIDRESYDTPKDVPLFFALGRLHQDKAFDTLLKAMAAIPNAYLWLAGAGPEENALRQLAQTLGVESRVRFLGWQSDPTTFFNTADAFICPSRHEPLGNVVLEGWVHKIPVIASQSEGPGHLITEGVNGLLFPVDNALELVRQLQNFLISPNLGRTLVANAWQTYQENYTQDRIVAQYLEYFQQLCEKGTKAS